MSQEYHDVDLSRTASWNVDPRNRKQDSTFYEDPSLPVSILLTWGAESKPSEEGVKDEWNQVTCTVVRNQDGSIEGIRMNEVEVKAISTTTELEDDLDTILQNSERVQKVHQGEPYSFYDTLHHGRDEIQFKPKDVLFPTVLTEEEEGQQKEVHQLLNDRIEHAQQTDLSQEIEALNPEISASSEVVFEEHNRIVKQLHDNFVQRRRKRTSQLT